MLPYQIPSSGVSSGLTPHSVNMPMGKPSKWQKVGFAKYYGYDHLDCPFDKEVVAAIRRDIDPFFIPLWVKNVYQSTSGGVLVFVRHVLAFGPGDYPQSRQHHDFRLAPPEFSAIQDKHYRLYSPRPHDLLEILEGPEIPWSPELPGAFVPLGWEHYHKYKALSWMMRDAIQNDLDPQEEQARAAWEAKKAEVEAVDRYWKQESDYRWEHDWRYLRKQHEGLTSEELRLIHASRLNSVHDGRFVN